MGDTKEDAYRNYKEVLESKGNNIDFSKNENLQKIEGIVSRINKDVKNGNSIYYITLKENEELIFTATSKVSTELPITIVGDKVTISYDKSNSSEASITEFDNKDIGKVEKTSEKEEDTDNK